jgi:hypothetical protein
MINRLSTGALVASLALLAARAGAAGIFTFAPITGDADSGISPAKTYTHAVDFGAGGNSGGFPNIVDPATTVNGVPFTIGGMQGTNYGTTGLNAYVGTNPWTSAVPNGDNSVGDLLNDFYWRNTPVAPADQTLTLTGLTPGTAYITTFYSAGWQPGVLRTVTVNASDGGSVTLNQDFTGYTKPNVLRYTFVAPGPSITYTFTPANPQNGFHQYAFTNEVAVPEPGGLCAGGLAGLLVLARRRRQ